MSVGIGQEIRCLQFCLWEDCSQNCSFCFFKHNNHKTSEKNKMRNIMSSEAIMDIQIGDNEHNTSKYNAVGLIGGELFDDSVGPMIFKKLKYLFQYLNLKLIKKEISEVWVASNLMGSVDKIDTILSLFDFNNFDDNQRVMLSTSYDTMGRFHNCISEELWWQNAYFVKRKYPKVFFHTQTIMTQDFIDKFNNGSFPLDKLLELGGIDFKPPRPFEMDNYSDLSVERYQEIIQEQKNMFGGKFFIENRASCLKFFRKLKDIFSAEKLRIFASPSVHSLDCFRFNPNMVVSDRHNSDNRLENAECGHNYDGYGYLNNPDKCIYCDALMVAED